KRFIPADKLWPINEYWYFHAGAINDNNTLEDTKRVLERRYGQSANAEEFSRKAQLADYEDVRAKYESYATHWSNRKMTINWMLNNHWPSFFGHLFDYYFKQGGGYFGAKKALAPMSVVWDYYATGDRSSAHVYAVNQTLKPLRNVSVRIRLYDLDGTQRYLGQKKNVSVPPASSLAVLTVGRVAGLSPVYFVRCQLSDETGKLLAENVYWQSQVDDEIGPATNDDQFATKLIRWSDMSSLENMPRTQLSMSATYQTLDGQNKAAIRLANPSNRIAFFVRLEITRGVDGQEVLPIRYDDNYVTIFPRENHSFDAVFDSSAVQGSPPALRIEGVNLSPQVAPLNQDTGR
ncbi:MAG: glycoside hydrolase, partial [Acidobacteria bacterium]|nr:glycoside hydrolase [Acidobacteriota bacterium]